MLGKILQNVNQIWFQNESPKSISFVSILPRVKSIKNIVSEWSEFLSRYYKQFTILNDDSNPTNIQENTKFKKTIEHTEYYFGEQNLKTIKKLQGCNVLQNIKENNQVYGGIFSNTYNLKAQNDQKNCKINNILKHENLEGKKEYKKNVPIKYQNIRISENKKCLRKKNDEVNLKMYNTQQLQDVRMQLNNSNPYLTIENRVKYFGGLVCVVHLFYPNIFSGEINQSKNKEKLGNFVDHISFKRSQTLIHSHDDTIDLNSISSIKTKFTKFCRSLPIQTMCGPNCLKLLKLDTCFFSNPERVTPNQLSDYRLMKRGMSTSNLHMKRLAVAPLVNDKRKIEVGHKTKPKINQFKPKKKILVVKREKKMKEKICGRKTSSITCCDVCHIKDDCTIKEKPKRGKSSPYVKIGCPGGLRGVWTSIYYLFKRDTKCKVKPLYPRKIHKPKLQKKKKKKTKTKNEDCMGKAAKGRIRSSPCMDVPKICTHRTAPCLELCVCNTKTQTPLERAREEMDCKPPPRATESKRKFKYNSSDLGIKCRRWFYNPKLRCGRRIKTIVQPRRKQVQYLTIGKCSAWKRFKNKRKRKYRDLL